MDLASNEAPTAPPVVRSNARREKRALFIVSILLSGCLEPCAKFVSSVAEPRHAFSPHEQGYRGVMDSASSEPDWDGITGPIRATTVHSSGPPRTLLPWAPVPVKYTWGSDVNPVPCLALSFLTGL